MLTRCQRNCWNIPIGCNQWEVVKAPSEVSSFSSSSPSIAISVVCAALCYWFHYLFERSNNWHEFHLFFLFLWITILLLFHSFRWITIHSIFVWLTWRNMSPSRRECSRMPNSRLRYASWLCMWDSIPFSSLSLCITTGTEEEEKRNKIMGQWEIIHISLS